MLPQSELFSYATSWSQSNQSKRFRWTIIRLEEILNDQPFFNRSFHILDIEDDFKKQLKVLIPELFRLENENFIKEINGEKITSTDLFEYFRVRSS